MKHRLGVLFVHGIGEQPEGDTLLRFGQPIINCLKTFLARGGPDRAGSVTVTKTVLTPSKLQINEPPHARLAVTGRKNADGARPEESWLMAESWWGGDVQPPPFGKMSGWMMTFGAWTILSHLTKHIAHHKYPVTRAVLYLFALVAWIVLASLLQIAIVALSLLAILPVPGMHKALAGMLLALTGVLGDSYVLIESDLQRSAIVKKTRKALEWLSDRCESVVVVAHSQGAAIAHLALREKGPDNVRALFTFGSGVQKLEELLHLRDVPSRARSVARLTPIFLVLVALLIRVAFFEPWAGDASTGAVVFVGLSIAVASIWALVSAQEHWNAFEASLLKLKLHESRENFHWIDVYASSDPVPNGALSSLGTAVATESVRIANLGDVLGDHTSYWENRAQFVPKAARCVAAHSAIPVFDDGSDEAMEAAASTHERNVVWLSVTFWAGIVAMALVPVLHWQHLSGTGRLLDAALTATGGPFERIASAFRAVARWWSPAVGAADVERIATAALGTLFVMALVALWRPAYRAIWRCWDDATLNYFSRFGAPQHPADRFFVDVLAITAGFAPLILVLSWMSMRGLLARTVIGGLLLVLYAVLGGAMIVQLVTKGLRAWKARKVDGDSWRELKQALLALAAILAVVVIILPRYATSFAPLRDLMMAAFGGYAAAAMSVATRRAAKARLDAVHAGRAFYAALDVLPGVFAAIGFVFGIRLIIGVKEAPGDMLMTVFVVPAMLYAFGVAAIWSVCWMFMRGLPGRARRVQ
jgi:hypothetical protein